MGALGRKLDRQRDSSSLAGVEQLELRIARRAAPAHVPVETIALQPTMTGAINLAINASGLADKEIADALGIDPATWSRIRSGQAHFPQDRLDPLCDLLGNDIPLQWWAHRRRYELKPLRSELEQQIDDLRAQLADRERDLDVIRRFVQQTR